MAILSDVTLLTYLTTQQAPPAIYEGAVAAGTAKASGTWEKIFKLGIVAGCHIGFGSYLAITVGGACPAIAEANPGLQKASRLGFSLLRNLQIFLTWKRLRSFSVHSAFLLVSS